MSIFVALLVAERFAGTSTAFAACSAAYAAMLALCAFRRAPYSAVYLAVFLWLGVWVKLVAHRALDYPAMFGHGYLEPIGAFDFSTAAWNDVIWTVTAGGIGVVAAVGTWLVLFGRGDGGDASPETPAPRWYPRYRWILWTAVGVTLLAMVVGNEGLGIFKLGWRPKVSVPWPLSGLTPWFFYIGAALIVAVLAGWDRSAGRAPWTGLSAAATEAVLSAGSIMSRGIFLFHAGAYIVAILREPSLWRQFRPWQTVCVVCAFCALFAVSIVWVTYARYLAPDALPVTEEEYRRSIEQPGAQVSGQTTDKSWGEVVRYSAHAFLALAVDRWPGLEGVMVLAAHQDKSWKFLAEAAKERRSVDRVDAYTRISSPKYTDAATAIYHYSANPGAIGFLYFSGSRWFVFFGMFALTGFAMMAESLVKTALRNPYATSLIALYVISMIIHLNPGLPQKALTLLTTLVACLGFAEVSRMTGGASDLKALSEPEPARDA